MDSSLPIFALVVEKDLENWIGVDAVVLDGILVIGFIVEIFLNIRETEQRARDII